MAIDWRAQIVAPLLGSTSVRRGYGLLRRIPLIGWLLHRVSRVAVPMGSRVWLPVPTGFGKGLWLHLDSRFETAYASGCYEQEIEALLLSGLQPGGVFYDVGAHIGFFSLLAARIVGSSGSVFSFEADPENAERIKQHASRNGLDHIHVIPLAVWSSPGPLIFELASSNSSRNQGAVISDRSKPNKNTIEVNSISLDAFAQAYPPPNLVKIDVEGGEAAVLKGSGEVFQSNSPILICEIHSQEAADDVLSWLKSNNYSFQWIKETHGYPRHLRAKLEV
jgi:FkbM family methyltransferase